ncbi:cadherin-like beta sandwich domain-containing protein [Cohnella cellulosilytica]|uniref:Cadherin-like beta sandwich domain-containing protein n=1 Tax=Cohnella cellulosilytica TaxID=986710 RepID=A0ABW2FF95_9BACL
MWFSVQRLSRVWLVQLIGLVLWAAVPLHPVAAVSAFADGDGSPGNPYLIENADQFNEIRNNLGASYKLMQNIDLSSYASADGGKGWKPIEGPFSGQLDGDGHWITGLVIRRGDEGRVGLFQYVGGQIDNLSIVGADVVGGSQTGILAGYMYLGTADDVHVSGELEGESFVGGLVGEIQHSQVRNSGSSAAVKGTGTHVGGLIGADTNSTNGNIIMNSYAEGDVEGQGTYTGGLIGLLMTGTVESSYASGKVVGENEVGGFVGSVFYGSVIRDSYALGTVRGNSAVGGFAGNIYESEFSDSYSIGAVTGDSSVGGFAGYTYNWTFDRLYWNSDAYWSAFGFSAGSITGISSIDLFKSASFGGMDFAGKWAIAEGKSYPYLRENAPLWLTDLTVIPDAGTAGNVAPAWHAFVHQYDLSVTGDVYALTPVPSMANADAIVQVSGMDGLEAGTHTATISLNDPKGVRSPQAYAINIHKLTSNDLSSDASLADLRIDGITIPGFSAGTSAYTVYVPNTTTDATITAAPNHPDATYTVTGGSNLQMGDNAVAVTVTASDGTTRTYTITINRNRFAGGSGTEASPYLVENAEQFNDIRNDYQKAYRLIADIDLSDYASANDGAGWEPIYFEGKLDGNGHAIRGLKIDRPYEDVVGLFQYIYIGSVSNLDIVQASVIGKDSVGILAGLHNSNTVSKVRTSGSVKGRNNVGGLVGSLHSGTIKASSSTAEVVGSGDAVGGLVGQGYSGIETSYAEGSAQGANKVGGLVGEDIGGTISNSFAIGDVKANLASAGGLIGRSSQGTYTNVYAAGKVQGSSAVGGLVGTRASSTFTRGYWNTETTGQSAAVGSGAVTGLTGYTTAQMKIGSSFGGWDFSGTWSIAPATTPYLRGAPLPLWLTDLTVTGNTGGAVSAPAPDNLTRSSAVAVAHDVQSVTVSGTAIDPAAVVAVSGGSNLSVGNNPITVTVTGANGDVGREYALNVVRSDPSGAGLSGITLSAGTLSPAFAEATTNYTVSVPYATSALTVAPYAANVGATLTVNGTGVDSGQASGNIGLAAGASTIIAIEVTSQDGSNTRSYTLTVSRASGSSNANLSALTTTGGALSPTFNAATIAYTAAGVSNTTSTITVRPTAADTNATLAVRVNDGTSIPVTSGQNSSALALNVGVNTIEITVTAQDGTGKNYAISVTRAASTVATLSGLTLSSGSLSPGFLSSRTAYTSTAASSFFNVTVRPTASNSGATITATVNGGDPVAVSSGTDSPALHLNAGSNTIQIYVLAQDGVTSRTYTITVTRSASTASDLTAFSFEGLSPAVTGTISGTNISLTVPYGTNVGELVATFASSPGSAVTVEGAEQTSGATPNDFSSAVSYKVTAENGTANQVYTVTVVVAASTSKDMTSFGFEGLTPPVTGAITGTDIAATVPYGTDVGELVATFESTGASVAVGTDTQVSGTTANDFTFPVTYTVTAQDGSTKDYTVTVSVAASTSKDMTSFGFAGLTPPVTGVISGTNIAATVPYGTNVRGLVATFGSTGASVAVGTETQASGTTANNFTSPVIYTVTAQDGSTKDYTVTVTIAANPSSGGGNGGGGSSGGNGGSGGGNNDGPADNAPTADDEIIIKAGQSGTFSRAGEISLVVPDGSTERDMIVQVKKITDVSGLQANGKTIIGPVYELIPKSSGNFTKKLLLRLSFNPALLSSSQRPAVFYYDEEEKDWVELGGVVEGSSLSVEIDRWAKYAVLPVRVDSDNEATSRRFNDVEGHWAASAIVQASAAGIASGYSDGTFRPNAPITRAEFAVMLVKALGIRGEGTELRFSDNSAIGGWAKNEIALAVKAGIISGYSNGAFRPNALITRAEMAVMLSNAQHAKPETNGSTTFADDAEIPAWSKGAIRSIAEQGIVQGRGGNRYAPMATASRAEAIVVLLKLSRTIN